MLVLTQYMNRASFYLTIILLLVSCTKNSDTCENGDKKCIQSKIDNHITRKISYWQKFYERPLNERVFIAPKELIEYIDLDNKKNAFPNKPFVPRVPKSFLKDIKEALYEIPESVKNLLDKKFAGVFLVNDLGGTGYTDYILDDTGKPIAGFVVLDFQVLQKRNANEWASWKESTPFKSSSSYSIEAVIETDITNNRKYAIQYILLHELGHIISINEFFHPPWGLSPNQVQNRDKYIFFNESWVIDKNDNKLISRFDNTILPERKNIVYYFGSKLNIEDAPKVYSNLEKTDFVTLYAATNPSDDWAESFVTYVHSVLMKKPFSIKIKENKKTIKTFKLCWKTSRCAKKEAILTNLFGK